MPIYTELIPFWYQLTYIFLDLKSCIFLDLKSSNDYNTQRSRELGIWTWSISSNKSYIGIDFFEIKEEMD